MHSQNQQNSNVFMWTPTSDMSAVGTMDDDLELFGHLSNITASTTPATAPLSYHASYNYMSTVSANTGGQAYGNNDSVDYLFHQEQQQQTPNLLSMVAPLVSPPMDLTDAVSRMNMEDQHHHDQRQRFSLNSTLSLDIQPCISITEPTPIHRMPALGLVDDFIAQHSSELTQEQQQSVFSHLMDPNSFLGDFLIDPSSRNSCDWLSWTPARGSSPVSVDGNSFDDQHSVHSSSSLDYNMMITSTDVFGTSPDMGFSVPSTTSFLNFNNHNPTNNNSLTVKKSSRSRRVSEPPRPSHSIIQEHQQQFNNTSTTDRSIRRSNSDRRSRSNSNSSLMMAASVPGSYHCPHPGCEKSFTRAYNLTSHMRTHTSERPFACSQCGRKFARQHDRNRHEKLHWGIKPYACMHCNKPFARMDALNRHLRVENGCGGHINQTAV